MNFRLASLACLLAAPLALHAENTEHASGNARFRILAIGRMPAFDVYVKTGGHYVRVDVPTDYIAKSFRTSAKQDIVFFKKRAGAKPEAADTKSKNSAAKPEDSDKSYEPIAVCKPDGNAARQLIFFFPGKKPDEWVTRAKSDIAGTFSPGTRLVMNLSDAKVRFDFGGTELMLNAMSSGLLLPAKTSTSEGMVPLKIFRLNASQNWTPFIATVWRQETKVRKVVLIYPAPAYDGLSIAVVKDTVEADDDAKKSEQRSKSI